ncbi:MAG: hypothetical protein KGO96_05655 [Elusimicrobia bacterium]|nr:hypothetical protein [Elusimicrobiota bacterium]MDE2237207.1 hypothetical protein [Elusimicrobiota bacterium]MDE2425375.1 hypothetical protein [Elusimicrobiota bacterium]
MILHALAAALALSAAHALPGASLPGTSLPSAVMRPDEKDLPLVSFTFDRCRYHEKNEDYFPGFTECDYAGGGDWALKLYTDDGATQSQVQLWRSGQYLAEFPRLPLSSSRHAELRGFAPGLGPVTLSFGDGYHNEGCEPNALLDGSGTLTLEDGENQRALPLTLVSCKAYGRDDYNPPYEVRSFIARDDYSLVVETDLGWPSEGVNKAFLVKGNAFIGTAMPIDTKAFAAQGRITLRVKDPENGDSFSVTLIKP